LGLSDQVGPGIWPAIDSVPRLDIRDDARLKFGRDLAVLFDTPGFDPLKILLLDSRTEITEWLCKLLRLEYLHRSLSSARAAALVAAEEVQPGLNTLALLFDEAINRRGVDLVTLARVLSENAARTDGIFPRKGPTAVGWMPTW